MSEYESPYFIPMRRSEKALRAPDTGDVLQAREILIRAQQEAEEALL